MFFTNCKKANTNELTQLKEKQSVLKQIDIIDIEYINTRTGEISKNPLYTNDTVFYHDSKRTTLYIKGKSYKIKYNEKTEDSIIQLFHLKKIDFKWKRKYQHHFEYEDCILKREIKMDSGAVHTLQGKNGAVFQVIDVEHKPLLLQVCYKDKTYKEKIQSEIDKVYKTITLNGHSGVFFYDEDKDGENELLIIKEVYDFVYAEVYKINLPK